jgi:hypothetical protein
MKVLLVFGLILGTIIPFGSRAASAQVGAPPRQSAKRDELQLTIVAPKRRYKRSEKITIPVMLLNSGKEDIYVYGTLGWGHSANLILHVRDASGKEIKPLGSPDDQIYFSRDDKTAFVKLVPNHFLGTNFFAPLDILNLNRVGRYTISA